LVSFHQQDHSEVTEETKIKVKNNKPWEYVKEKWPTL
jgi:hypothetical protein